MPYVYVYILKIYVQIYYDFLKINKCLVIHFKWTYQRFLQIQDMNSIPQISFWVMD